MKPQASPPPAPCPAASPRVELEGTLPGADGEGASRRTRLSPRPLPPLALLDEILAYDPETGAFLNKKRRGTRAAGLPKAKKLKGGGYLNLRICGTLHKAHRLAFYIHHRREPEGDIDHIDGNKRNNRISNLREASRSNNCCNKRIHTNNTSGVKGVDWHSNRWRARILAHGVSQCIGRFKTIGEAEAAVREARERLHGEFARH